MYENKEKHEKVFSPNFLNSKLDYTNTDKLVS